eukprot:19827-Heterococcus_DN1.PRE.2
MLYNTREGQLQSAIAAVAVSVAVAVAVSAVAAVAAAVAAMVAVAVLVAVAVAVLPRFNKLPFRSLPVVVFWSNSTELHSVTSEMCTYPALSRLHTAHGTSCFAGSVVRSAVQALEIARCVASCLLCVAGAA